MEDSAAAAAATAVAAAMEAAMAVTGRAEGKEGRFACCYALRRTCHLACTRICE